MSFSPTPGRSPVLGAGGAPMLSGNALAVGSMILWAAGFPAAEILLQDWHPVVLISLRLLMAMAVLLPLWAIADGGRSLRNAPWVKGIRIGFFGFGLATTLLLFAQWYTDPVTVALIASATPILATLIEVWEGQRRLTRNFVVGMILSVIGGTVAVGKLAGPDLGLGLLLALLSGFLFSWASNAAVRQLPTLSPIGRSTITFAGASVFVAIMLSTSLIFNLVPWPDTITLPQLGHLAIYAVAAMALSQILFIASVGRIGIALTAFHLNISPFYVMIIMVSLGGDWNLNAVMGATIVAFGVLWSQRPSRAPMMQEREQSAFTPPIPPKE